jgi:charged multivesicular body protein 4A/B
LDDDELEEELEALQQEQLDEQMLNTGTVPMADEVHKVSRVANGEREFPCTMSRIYVKMARDVRNGRAIRRADDDIDITVKNKPAAVQEDDEEEELRKLQAEMAM